MSHDTLLEFPCAFPIKIMGDNTAEFEATVIRIVRQHIPNLGEGAVRQNHSKKGNYLALTVTIQAESKAQLDALYQELTACELTKMVL